MVANHQDERSDGFTLIELLVVIIIIGILAAIAIPIYLNQRKRGYDASMRSDLRTAAEEMELYYSEYGNYPSLSQAGRSVTIGSDTFVVSPGVSLTGYLPGDPGVIAGTYCLKAVNPNSTGDLYYDSDQGGLLPHGAVCS